MTENGEPENDSKIQNEEHQHDATAKRTLLVDTSGNPHGPVDPEVGILASTSGTFVVSTSTPTLLYSATTDRIGFFVQNEGPNDVYLGFTSGLTTTSNYFAKLTQGESSCWRFTNTIYTIASTANSTISHGSG